jgi:hypothetical protein
MRNKMLVGKTFKLSHLANGSYFYIDFFLQRFQGSECEAKYGVWVGQLV